MHKVYRNSYCNIAAADAEDSKSGLFRKRNPQDVIPAYFETDGSSALLGKQRWRIVREDLWNSDLLSRPLYKRGWVFQGQSVQHNHRQRPTMKQNECSRPEYYTSPVARSSGIVQR